MRKSRSAGQPDVHAVPASGGVEPDLIRSWEVVVRGATAQTLLTLTISAWITGAALICFVLALLAGKHPLHEPTLWVVPAVAGAIYVVAAARLSALARLLKHRPSDPARRDEVTAEPTKGLIICCSGGGVKSAAFSLGGMQRLARDATYRNSRAVVGVSGGGYMAAAFAVARLHAKANGRDPDAALAPDSNEVAALRRVTNYLGATNRVRYDLVLSLLRGLLVNGLLLVSGAATMGWLAGTITNLTQAVHIDKNAEWTLNASAWWALVPLGLMLFVSFLIFLRYGFNGAPLQGRTRLRTCSVLPARFKEPLVWNEIVNWSRSLPNQLIGFALVSLAVHPGAIAVSTYLHNNWSHAYSTASKLLAQTAVSTGVTSLVVAWLARSTYKGLKTRPGGGSVGSLVARFRRRVAPVLGLAIIGLGLYGIVIALAGYMASHPHSTTGYSVILLAFITLEVMQSALSANGTSMFRFYRSRLSAAYLETPQCLTAGGAGQDVSLADMPGTDPELVLCGTANITFPGVTPTGRNGTPFIMGASIGLTDGQLPGGSLLIPAAQYQVNDTPYKETCLDVATAMAISGAAVAPVAGRETRRIGAARVLLAIFNVRLGYWLPNPHWVRTRHALTNVPKSPLTQLGEFMDRASTLYVVEEAVRALSPTLPLLYVTDGGHYDNLGLVEALRRRPAKIVVFDGSGDAEDNFPTMGHAIATARMDHGIQISFNPEPMTRQAGELGAPKQPPASGWTLAKARYPDGSECVIRYVKCVLPGRRSWDLHSYQLEHPGFPAVTEKMELFDEFDFEAFRQLGWSLTDAAIRARWASGSKVGGPTSQPSSRAHDRPLPGSADLAGAA